MEIIGAITGLLYVYLSIKQNILLWPLGIITSIFQLMVFYNSRIYADMSLQVYYVLISTYGWYVWKNGKKKEDKERPVQYLNKRKWTVFFLVSLILFLLLCFVLMKFTNSDVPNIDAFTTALSITGTFLLAKKYIENWYVWILVDVVSSGLYIYKGLYFFAALYFFLAIVSIIGIKEWKREWNG